MVGDPGYNAKLRLFILPDAGKLVAAEAGSFYLKGVDQNENE
jgi:hypothetical protein